MTAVNVDLNTPVAQKDKDATKNYVFNFTGLLAPGDTLASMAWSTPTPGITIGASSFTDLSATVKLSGGTENIWYAVVGSYVTALGEEDQIVLRLFITEDREDLSGLGSALFPNRFTAVAALRRDRLVSVAIAGNLLEVSDDYLWEKLVAAEADVARHLRVPLQVTQFFPADPTQAQIDALPVGMPYAVDPGYDYQPDFFNSDRWGFIPLRKKPVISVQAVKIAFPGAALSTFDIPSDWLTADKKYGQLQFVPRSGAGGVPLHAFMLQALGMGRNIPFAIQVTYRAGLVASEYPDLIDLVKKKAVLKVLEDKFFPSSGSVSADGLSQSLSIDMEKYRDTTDAILNGPKGVNGGLMAAIHGVRMAVL